MKNRNYCFTSFKETLEVKMDQIKYIVYGKEIAPSTGRSHLQGYVEFFNPKRIKAAQDAIGDNEAHIEKRRGTRDEARSYCMKDNNFTYHGLWEPTAQGKRSDLHELVDKIESGVTDYELLKDNPQQVFQFERFIKNARRIIAENKCEEYKKEFKTNFKCLPIQTDIINILKQQTERQILWIYDPVGNSGKTWLSKYLVSCGAIRYTNAKTRDIAFSYNGEDPVIFDFSRSLNDKLNYDIIEQLKNGLIFSSKYESKSKMFRPPKILILSNALPITSKLSEDRWCIYQIEDNKLEKLNI